MQTEIEILYNLYDTYLFIIAVSFLLALLVTPLTGVLSTRLNAVDISPVNRDRSDKTRDRRIHRRDMPNLGGIGLTIGMLGGVAIAFMVGQLTEFDQKLLHIILGIFIIVLLGFYDSVNDLPAKRQIFYQIVAALVVTTGGIKIDVIHLMGIQIDFTLINFEIPLSQMTLYISPIADLITIIWIVGIINAINWVSGIDGLAASMSLFAAVTFLFIGVRTDSVIAAILSASLVGGIMGFLPYNLPSAKTFNGSAGDMLQGYLLAILAIVSGAKFSASIILLSLPVIDSLWVLVGRYLRHKQELNGPLDIMNISDKTHLHHRLMDLGLSVRQTLVVEISIFLVFCFTAYYVAGFSELTLAVLGTVLACFIMFTFIAIIRARSTKKSAAQEAELENDDDSPPPVITEAPEEKYAY